MTMSEFEQQVFVVAMASPICGIPAVRRLTATFISLRIDVATDGFIDAFYNPRQTQGIYRIQGSLALCP